MMAYNLVATARAGKAVDGEATVVVPRVVETEPRWEEILTGKPVILVTIVAVVAGSMAVVNNEASIFLATTLVMVAVLGTVALHLATDHTRPTWHRLLEGRALMFTAFSVIAVLAGGVAELVPSLLATPTQEMTAQSRPYRPLELEGRDIYVREGCYVCHSQMIRTFSFEAKRYGEPSTMADSVYDHPFQWGSKRTGPDLAREGGKYPNLWHYRHMIDPREVSPGSIMPPFPTLATDKVDASRTADKLRALRSIGVPYDAKDIESAASDEKAQAQEIAENLRMDGANAQPDSEIVALIAYLQRLGVQPKPQAPAGQGRVSMAQ
jgi:cytochrome c oxidase cbb3-type subunit I/II